MWEIPQPERVDLLKDDGLKPRMEGLQIRIEMQTCSPISVNARQAGV